MKFFSKKSKKENEKKFESSGLNILDVDLIKEEGKEGPNWGKYIGLIFLTVIASSVFCLEIYWLITWWEEQESNRAQEIEESIKTVQAEISQLEAEYKELNKFKIRADIMTSLLDSHPYWTNFFNFIETITLSTVNWSHFAGDLSGVYSLQASANTFADISWQVRSFLDHDLVNSVSVDSGSGGLREETIRMEGLLDEDGEIETRRVRSSTVDFFLELELDPTIFYYQ